MQFINKNICLGCGAKADEQHHVVPKSLGGMGTVPLCVKCHDLVHGGLGDNRLQHKELTKRGINRKQALQFHYVWWFHFKCAGSDEWKDIKTLSSDLEVSATTINKYIARLKEIEAAFLAELVLPYVGYGYYGTTIFNLEPFIVTECDYLVLIENRKKIDASVMKELAMA